MNHTKQQCTHTHTRARAHASNFILLNWCAQFVIGFIELFSLWIGMITLFLYGRNSRLIVSFRLLGVHIQKSK